MPIVTINMIEGRTKTQKRALVKEVTDAICRTIKTSKEKVKIIINEMKEDNYAVAGLLKIDETKK